MRRSPRNRALIVAGTRPELIKQAPVIRSLLRSGQSDVKFCWVAQHRELVAGMFDELGVAPDLTVELPPSSGNLREQRAGIKTMMSGVIRTLRPDITIVQGDTTTAYASAMASTECGAAVAHVEAGLRSNNLRSPWPEELHRRAISKATSIHFAPTTMARQNLLQEGVPAHKIWITGNTGIDSLRETVQRNSLEAIHELARLPLSQLLDSGKPFVLATMHRREALGAKLIAVLDSLQQVAAANQASVIFVRHANPTQARTLESARSDENLIVTPSLSYHAFLTLLARASVVVTDSGGVTEEATALGIPTIVARTGFERAESLASNHVKLIAPDSPAFLNELTAMLRAAPNTVRTRLTNETFGDGRAADRIAALIDSVGLQAAARRGSRVSAV